MDTVTPIFSATTIVVRMADEGLPVCAIARALRMPSDDVREIISIAIENGAIIEYPQEDWPPNSRRSTRQIRIEGFDDEEQLHIACERFFGTTRQQSIVLGVLLRRSEATKEQLHQKIEAARIGASVATDIKLVDVLICILRRKLKKFASAWYGEETYPLIQTMWGRGYLMEASARSHAIAALQDFIKQANTLAPVEAAA